MLDPWSRPGSSCSAGSAPRPAARRYPTTRGASARHGSSSSCLRSRADIGCTASRRWTPCGRELDASAAANNLNQAVHVARRALGAGTIEAKDGLLLLHAEVDVDAFEAAATAALRSRAVPALRTALGLYRGELLPENRYDDFAEARREELEVLAAELASALEELDEAGGRLRLPADASSFVGRRHELAELNSLLRRGRLLTLTGTGGAGKTRLALELARSAQASFADGAALVELAPARPALRRDRGGSRPRRAGAARPEPRGGGRGLPGRPRAAARPRQLRARAGGELGAGRRNCFAARPDLTLLATSREPLRLPGEIVFRVPSLGIPDPELHPGPDGVSGYESVSLFVERAAAVARGFELTEENAAGRRPDLLPARRAAAGARACGRPGRRAQPRGDRRAARRPLPPAPIGIEPVSDTAADPRGDAALEPRPARARRAGALPPPRRLRRRIRAGGGRGGLHRRPARAPRGRRRAGAARREVARQLRRAGPGSPLPAARDRPSLRPRPARGGRGGERARRVPCLLGPGARRGDRRHAGSRPRGTESPRGPRHAVGDEPRGHASLLHGAHAVLAPAHRPHRGAAALRRGPRRRARADADSCGRAARGLCGRLPLGDHARRTRPCRGEPRGRRRDRRQARGVESVATAGRVRLCLGRRPHLHGLPRAARWPSPAGRTFRAPRPSASTPSARPTGSCTSRTGQRSAWPRASSCSEASPAPTRRSRRRSTSASCARPGAAPSGRG